MTFSSTMIEQYISQFLRALANAAAEIQAATSDGEHNLLSGCDQPAPDDPATPPAGVLVGSVTDGNGLVINIYGEEADNSVMMTVKVMEGVADLRGFFMDVGDSTEGVSVEGIAECDLKIGDEAVTSVGGRDNNLNGTGEEFDVGMEFGTAGTRKDDISEASFTLQGVGLADLDGLTFGVRATSVGEDRDDGVKLVGEFDVPPPAEDATDSAGEAGNGTGGTDAGGTDTSGTDTSGTGTSGGVVVGDSFPELHEDIAYATYYFDMDPSTVEFELQTVRVNNFPDSYDDPLLWVANDLDDGREPPLYKLVWNELKMEDEALAGAKLLGISVAGVDAFQEQYYALDGTVDPNPDLVPTSDGELVAEANQTFDYAYLFS